MEENRSSGVESKQGSGQIYNTFFFADGCSFGAGIYFARDASYAHILTTTDAQGFRYILLCRVVIGDYTTGHENMRTPPTKPGSSLQFDSTVDDIDSPQVFAVFNNFAAYPEYIIRL